MVKGDSVSGKGFDIRGRSAIFEEVSQVVVRIIFGHDPDDVWSVGGFGQFGERRCKSENGSEKC